MTESTGKNRLKASQIKLGLAIPWSLFDTRGNMLLSEGHVIETEEQVERLISREAYYYLGPDITRYKPISHQVVSWSSFRVVTHLIERIETTFTLATSPDKAQTFVRKVMRLATDIQSVCSENPNAMLGTCQLMLEAPTVVMHALQSAITCEIAAFRMGFGVLDRLPLIAAALTQNLSVLELQKRLAEQQTELTEEQRNSIHEHPRASVELLSSHGVTDKRWLTAVLQHHERLDGSGYPEGLKEDRISEHARLLAIVDSYVAMTRPRTYRHPLRTKSAMNEIFKQRGKAIDAKVARRFLNLMGLFAPGSLIRLNSGAIAIISASGENLETAFITIIADQQGAPLERLKAAKPISVNEISGVMNLDEHRTLVAHMGAIWPDMRPVF